MGRAICIILQFADDEPKLCTQIERIIEEISEENVFHTEVFYTCEKLYQAMEAGEHFDLIFLDIEFKQMNGVSMGRRIRDELKNEQVQIVYVSSKESYAMELFESRPMNFLIKPVTEEKIRGCICKGMELSQWEENCFEIKTGKEVRRVPLSQIRYFESDNRKIKIHCEEAVYEVYGKLDVIAETVGTKFVRVHKSYLVNERKVARWRPESVWFSDGEQLPISRNYRMEVFKSADKRR